MRNWSKDTDEHGIVTYTSTKGKTVVVAPVGDKYVVYSCRKLGPALKLYKLTEKPNKQAATKAAKRRMKELSG